MIILFILNEAPYGSEKTYNALRLAMALQKEQPDTEVLVFLMADAVIAALPAQATPQGYYNIERMLKYVLKKGGQVKLCGTCCEARGIKATPLLEGVDISTMSQLAQWTVEADNRLISCLSYDDGDLRVAIFFGYVRLLLAEGGRLVGAYISHH